VPQGAVRTSVWRALHEVLLARLNGAEEIDRSRAVVDSSYMRAVLGASKPVPARWTGAKPAQSATWITDGRGLPPLGCLLSAASCNDVTQLLPFLEAIPPARGKRGRPRRRPSLGAS
jgi:hypothetical protein